MARSVTCALFVLALPLAASGFEAVGTIKKIDADSSLIYIFANGQDRTVKAAKDIKVYDANGKELKEGLKAKELKDGVEVTVTVERGDGGPTITAIRLGKKAPAPSGTAEGGKNSVGLKPLNEMSATEKYKGEDGGLYGSGKNEPPESHQKSAARESARIVPLDADGNPAKDGTIALISISMSNATQEFSFFKQVADRDKDKSPLVTIVDCAQGGQAMAEWVDPKGGPWTEADRRMRAARVSPKQVQAAWIKLANKGPSGDLQQHGKKLQNDTLAVLHNAKEKFPNLRVVYLGSRIYGGYSSGRLNP